MIVLTGGAGFIGSNILRRLNSIGRDDVLVVDNLTRADKYRNLVGCQFADYFAKGDFLPVLTSGRLGKVDAILHQGACTDTMEYNGDYMMRNNFDYSKELLHYAVDKRIPMVYASSAAVYGHVELAVEDAGDEAPLNIYGYSKLLFDQYFRSLAPKIESTVVGLRYFNVYGNGEAHKGKMSSMVYQFYHQVKDTGVARLFGGFGPFGPGEQKRDFVHVDDLVDMNMHFLDGPARQTVVNAGSGQSRTWNDLAKAVINEVGHGKVEYIDFPEGLKDKYQFNTWADHKHLRSIGYDKPFKTLEEGVHAYLTDIDRATAKFKAFPA